MIVSNRPSSNESFQLAGTGPRGAAYRVQASTNLAIPRTNWLTVSNGIFSGGVFIWSDANAANYSRRFYQVVTP